MPGYRDARGNYHAQTDASRAGYEDLKRELERQRGPIELDYATEDSLRSLYGAAWVDKVKRGW